MLPPFWPVSAYEEDGLPVIYQTLIFSHSNPEPES